MSKSGGAIYQQEWRKKHPDKVKEYKDAYYAKNRERYQEMTRERYRIRKDELRERARARNFKEREEVLIYLGDKCVHCGYADRRALQVDHVHGGGTQEMEAKKFSWRKYYKKILSLPPGEVYQLLCANCNSIKRVETPNEKAGPKFKY